MPTIAPIAPKVGLYYCCGWRHAFARKYAIVSNTTQMDTLLQTLESVRSGLMVASVIPALIAVTTLPRAMPANMPTMMV